MSSEKVEVEDKYVAQDLEDHALSCLLDLYEENECIAPPNHKTRPTCRQSHQAIDKIHNNCRALAHSSMARSHEKWLEVGTALQQIQIYVNLVLQREGKPCACKMKWKCKICACCFDKHCSHLGQLGRSWIQWTQQSRKTFSRENIPIQWSRQLGLKDSSGELCTFLDSVAFTFPEFEKKHLKPRLEQSGDFARLHLVPKPMRKSVVIQNEIYKRLCVREWIKIYNQLENESKSLREMKESAIGGLRKLVDWAAEERKAKLSEVHSRRRERDNEAKTQWANWKQHKIQHRIQLPQGEVVKQMFPKVCIGKEFQKE